MTPEDDMLQEIYKALSKMSPPEAFAETVRLINEAMPNMPASNLRDIQQQITDEMDASTPLVAKVLDMLEGHLALRSMGLLPEPGGDDEGGGKGI